MSAPKQVRPDVFAAYVLAYIEGVQKARREGLADYIPGIDGPVSLRMEPATISGKLDFLGLRETSERRWRFDL